MPCASHCACRSATVFAGGGVDHDAPAQRSAPPQGGSATASACGAALRRSSRCSDPLRCRSALAIACRELASHVRTTAARRQRRACQRGSRCNNALPTVPVPSSASRRRDCATAHAGRTATPRSCFGDRVSALRTRLTQRLGACQARGKIGHAGPPSASMPTDSRSRPSVMPAAARASGVIAAWVIVAGCAIRLSTPPSDSARVKQLQAVDEGAHRRLATAMRVRRSASRRSRAAGARPARGPGCDGQARVVHLRHRRMRVAASAASAAAFSWCTRRRASSVRRPRRVRKLSNGEPVRPSALAHHASCSCSAGVPARSPRRRPRRCGR